jgi:hypothetical protein
VIQSVSVPPTTVGCELDAGYVGDWRVTPAGVRFYSFKLI